MILEIKEYDSKHPIPTVIPTQFLLVVVFFEASNPGYLLVRSHFNSGYSSPRSTTLVSWAQ